MHLKLMQFPDSLPAEVAKVAPGFIGSLVALRWINGSPIQKIGAVIGGSSGSYYGSEYLAGLLGIHFGFFAWLFGLFGMAIAHKLIEGINKFDLSEKFNNFLKRFGL